MSIKLFDQVISIVDFDKVHPGTLGTVVEIWEEGKLYEIEFFGQDYKTIGCITMNPSQFRKLSEEGNALFK